MTDMKHMNYLETVSKQDTAELKIKEATYRGSWKKRGGIGAFMMLARKWDRLEYMLEAQGYDIFAAIAQKPKGEDGSPLAEVRDLRRYLLLVEAEMIARHIVGYVPTDRPDHAIIIKPGTPEDGGHHARMERLSDGLGEKDLGANDLKFYRSVATTSGTRMVVDRENTPPELWEHLPRLAPELNSKEHEETPAEYQHLYRWNKGDNKWVMMDRYRGNWAR